MMTIIAQRVAKAAVAIAATAKNDDRIGMIFEWLNLPDELLRKVKELQWKDTMETKLSELLILHFDVHCES